MYQMPKGSGDGPFTRARQKIFHGQKENIEGVLLWVYSKVYLNPIDSRNDSELIHADFTWRKGGERVYLTITQSRIARRLLHFVRNDK